MIRIPRPVTESPPVPPVRPDPDMVSFCGTYDDGSTRQRRFSANLPWLVKKEVAP